MYSTQFSDSPLDGIDIAESFGFKDPKMYNQNSPSPLRRQKYTCYSCGGNSGKEQECKVCEGEKRINDGNPMVSFLTTLMNLKLGLDHNRSNLDNPSLKPQFSEIKQEEGQISCDLCNNEIQNQEFMGCKENCHFYLCLQCYSCHKYEHEHQLIKRKFQDFSTSNDNQWLTRNNSNTSEDIQQIFLKHKKSSKPQNDICSLCGAKFKDNIIQICKTCQQRGWTFEVCHQCSKNVKEKHIPKHIMKPSLFKTSAKKYRQENLFDSVEEQRPSYSGNWIDTGAQPKISQIIPDEEESEEEIEQKQDQQVKCSPNKKKSLQNYDDCAIGFFTRQESPEKRDMMSDMSSRIQVVYDESDSEVSQNRCKRGLIKSEVIESENQYDQFGSQESHRQQNIIFSIQQKKEETKMNLPILPVSKDDLILSGTPTVFKRSSSNDSSENRSHSPNQNQGQNQTRKANVRFTESQSEQSNKSGSQDFCFTDYLCDYCEEVPKKVRYHCQCCKDYDLCKKCYAKRKSIHPLHQNFLEVNKQMEKQILTKEEENQKKIFEAILDKFGVISRASEKKQQQSERPVFRSFIGSNRNSEKRKSERGLRMSYW